VLNRLRAPFETHASLGTMQGAFSADLPGRKGGVALPAPRIESRRVTLWGEAFGAAGRSHSDGNAASLERRGGGMLAGVELESSGVSLWRVGALAGFTRHHFDLDARRSSGTQDAVHAALYGGARLGAVTLRAGAAYGWNETDLTRQVLLRGFSDVLRHDGSGSTMQGFAEIGYGVQMGAVGFEPFAQIAFVHVRSEAGTEQGGAAALRASGSSQSLGFTTLGLRAEAQIAGMPLFARGMLGWRHAFGETTPSARLAFASGGGAFNVYAAPVARDALVAEAGLSWRVSGMTSLGVAYTAALGDSQRDHALKGRLDVRF
jgi:outer membrane autotransporter protein